MLSLPHKLPFAAQEVVEVFLVYTVPQFPPFARNNRCLDLIGTDIWNFYDLCCV